MRRPFGQGSGDDEWVEQISITIELDDDGYWDRHCPWEECGFFFKILYEDWKDKVSNEAAYCPFCRHQAEASDFHTEEQAEYIRQAALAHITPMLGDWLRGEARSFNQSQPQGGLISMRMDVSVPPVMVPVPPATADAMTLRITCEQCSCRFAVVGAAYFCHACGHNSAEHTFGQSLTSARASIQALSTVTAAITDKDAAAQAARMLTEGTLGSLVTAFQRFAEVLYPRLPNASVATPRRNAFQNLDEGSRLWEAAGGRSYEKIVGQTNLMLLRRMFQQRHLLAHQEGMVDQDYITRSGDIGYRVGQRLVVRGDAVLACTVVLEQLAAGMKGDI
jgi:hypothetical protein